MDRVPVEVAAGAVVVLGGSGVAQRYAGMERVADRGVSQRLRAEVPRATSAIRNAQEVHGCLE